MAAGDWLEALWPVVRAQLPEPPARVLDVGCGPLGGFVPFLHAASYEAAGVDPNAPETAGYHRVPFEHADLPETADALIASTSLHHVGDPEAVIDRLARTLTPDGRLVVVEWAWERFDADTARWCFERLPAEGWIRRRHDEWSASGQPWETAFQGWAAEAGLHRGDTLVRLLDERFRRLHLSYGPFCFADLAGTTAADEQAAIDAGAIRATRIDWTGRPR